MTINQPALWGPVFNIGNIATAATTTADELDAGLSSVATLQDGRLVCVWKARDAQGHDSVEARFLDADGSPDGQAFKVNILESDHFAAPQVEVLSNGNFVVSYGMSDPDPSVTHTQAEVHLFSPDGTSLAHTTVPDLNITQPQVRVAARSDGGYLVTASPAGGGIKSVFFDAGGAELVSTTGYSGDSISSPRTATLSDGRYVTVFTVQGDSSHPDRLVYDVRNPDGSITHPESLILPAVTNASRVSVTALAGGNFAVTWIENGSAGGALKGIVIGEDGGFRTTATTLFTSDAHRLERADVMARPDGTFGYVFAVMEEGSDVLHVGTSGTDGVHEFYGAAPFNGELTHLIDPSLTLLADGRILVKWSETGGAGIYGQIFDPRDQAETWSGDGQHGGTRFGDQLTGGAGHDVLFGAEGDDLLAGGGGDDRLVGGAGTNTLEGGAGADTLDGSGGTSIASYLHAQGNADGHGVDAGLNFPDGSHNTGDAAGDHYVHIDGLQGSNHDDVLVGNDNGNWIGGEAGNDVLDGGAGADTLDGGGGWDTVSYLATPASHGGIAVDLTTNQNGGAAAGDVLLNVEAVRGTDAADTIVGVDRGNGNGVELYGEGGDDHLVGKGGDDRLDGGAGNDTLTGGWGSDTLDGGAGTDTVLYNDTPYGVTVNLADSSKNAGAAAGDVLTHVENVTGSQDRDMLTGDAAANRLDGGAGDDTLVGGWGSDTLDGGAGIDTVRYDDTSYGVQVNLSDSGQNAGAAAGDVLTGIENVIGSGSADALTGDSHANRLDGGGGDDTLAGGAGDTLVGGAGNDTFVIHDADIRVVEAQGEGTDTVETSVSYALAPDAEVETIKAAAGASALHLTGNGFANTLEGSSGNDTLDGGGGTDTALFSGPRSAYGVTAQADGSVIVTGPDGTDLLRNIHFAEFGDQTLDLSTVPVTSPPTSDGTDVPTSGGTGVPTSGGTGVPTAGGTGLPEDPGLVLRGTAHADRLSGHGGGDQIYGLAGNDRLSGFGGDDTLRGGSGRDVLSGGDGKDVFVFDARPGKTNTDKIADFTVTDDTIWLENSLFRSDTALYAAVRHGSETHPQAMKKAFFTIGDHARDGNDFFVYDAKKGILFYDADGSGAKAAVAIATLPKHLKMTSHDFFFV